MTKQILVLAPYFPPWQYYTYFFNRLHSQADPLLNRFDIRNNFNIKSSDFNKYSAVILLYHDPLKQLYPEIYQNSLSIYKKAKKRGIPFINDPVSLSNTAKSVQGAIWTENKIPCARTRAFKDLDDLLSQNPGFPLFLRYDYGHDSMGNYFSQPIANVEELIRTYSVFIKKIVKRQHFDKPVAVQWIDTKDDKGIYRKYRTYVFGDKVINGSMLASYNWFIHTHERILEKWAIKENRDFMFGKPHDQEMVKNATSSLGLSINAVDYSIQKNGRLTLWESNPHPAFGTWIEDDEDYQKLFIESLKNFFRKYLKNE